MTRDSSFKDLYPNIFQLSSIHNEAISNFVKVEENSFASSWGLHLRRALRAEVNELSSLLGSLDSVDLVARVDDTRVWEENPSGVFSAKSFYESFFSIKDSFFYTVSCHLEKSDPTKRFKFSHGLQ